MIRTCLHSAAPVVKSPSASPPTSVSYNNPFVVPTRTGPDDDPLTGQVLQATEVISKPLNLTN